ncbi:TPA: ABC transporter ATP-binding protein [Streptococcus suis]|nr:ABC transporter ATP-binding protein [Streptococcus suis]HEM3647922.1 ABC transporter ATP-binding protein [Streptococcus suis]
MIKLEGVSKSYQKKRIFSNIHMKIKRGELTIVCGKSGIGKTTLLEMLAGLRGLDTGRYLYCEQNVPFDDDEKMSAFRNAHIGYMVQDFALIEDYTVLENLLLPSLYSKTHSREQVEVKAMELANRFDVMEILDEKVKNISGGQKQRISLIRSLILNPAIILADEPTSNLDSENFHLVVNLFQELRNEGKIILISTHDERLFEVADTLYCIKNEQLDKIR